MWKMLASYSSYRFCSSDNEIGDEEFDDGSSNGMEQNVRIFCPNIRLRTRTDQSIFCVGTFWAGNAFLTL